MNLCIIATGGTFDKRYDPINGELGFADSVIPAALARARMNAEVDFVALLAMDSLDMHDQHRRQISDACASAPQQHIVIVHGTDTAQQTAQVIAQAAHQKTIVLTGAMVPYEIDGSDALFNLGFAMAAAQLLPAGVYIAMNAQVFPWDDVRKNRQAGRFERNR